MKTILRRGLAAALALAASIAHSPGLRAELAGRPEITPAPALSALLKRAADAAFRLPLSPALKADELAVTLVDLSRPGAPTCASLRGGEPVYPASVVKLFYLAAAHRWMEDRRIADTPELRRALRDMIVESFNEATHYVVDVLTDTTSGPELDDPALTVWHDRRQAVNRYFAGLGYAGINADKKPWCEGPYGRETQAIRRFSPGRNLLTTDATARLLYEIAVRKAVTPARCDQMLELLRRDPFSPANDPEDQAHGFTGMALLGRPGAKLWSKAGWTSETRHDAALVELSDGRRFILVTFTVGHSAVREIIPAVARVVAEGLGR